MSRTIDKPALYRTARQWDAARRELAPYIDRLVDRFTRNREAIDLRHLYLYVREDWRRDHRGWRAFRFSLHEFKEIVRLCGYFVEERFERRMRRFNVYRRTSA